MFFTWMMSQMKINFAEPYFCTKTLEGTCLVRLGEIVLYNPEKENFRTKQNRLSRNSKQLHRWFVSRDIITQVTSQDERKTSRAATSGNLILRLNSLWCLQPRNQYFIHNGFTNQKCHSKKCNTKVYFC